MCHEVDYRRCSSPAQPFGRIAFSPFGRAGNLNSASIPENRKIALLDSFVRTSFGSELAVFSTGINRAQGARFLRRAVQPFPFARNDATAASSRMLL